MADGQYLEQFVSDPGGQTSRSKYKFPKKIPRGEIGRYGSTSGTNTRQLGTSFIFLLENGRPQPTEYGDGFIALQTTTSIESMKGKYTITFLH